MAIFLWGPFSLYRHGRSLTVRGRKRPAFKQDYVLLKKNGLYKNCIWFHHKCPNMFAVEIDILNARGLKGGV